MEERLRVAVLAIVQGVTGFLPISSSGHLIITRELFGWEFEDDLTLDVALHLGTTVAVLTYFWKEWAAMLRAAVRWLAVRGRDAPRDAVYDHRLLMLLMLGSLPAAAIGLALNDFVEENVRSPVVVGAMLIVFAVVLFGADFLSSRRRSVGDCGWLDALLVGAAQAIALVPGVSRSGVTVSAALSRGFERVDGTRFSFLLATPIIVGAGGVRLLEALADGIPSGDLGMMAAGAAVAAVTGWLAIRYLLARLGTSGFLPFVLYRLAVGAFILVYFATYKRGRAPSASPPA